jgi:outer membrane protein, multidrug efflux system
MNLSVRFSDTEQPNTEQPNTEQPNTEQPNTEHKKRAIAIAIACSVLPVLPSCVPPSPSPGEGPDLPESFDGATSSENSSPLTIEEFFDHLMLMSLIHQALGGNQELRILAENVQIASNEILAGYNQRSYGSLKGGGYPGDATSTSTPSGPRCRGVPRPESLRPRNGWGSPTP